MVPGIRLHFLSGRRGGAEKFLHRKIYVYTSIVVVMVEDSLPGLPCLCASLRRSSRAVTQLYEQELRPFGIKATQFTILQVLSRTGEVSQGRLALMLAIDSTSLTRMLEIMRRRRWIADRRGKDRRERRLRLAKAGQAQLDRALPAWERAQSRMRRHLSGQAWHDLLHWTDQVTSFASTQGG